METAEEEFKDMLTEEDHEKVEPNKPTENTSDTVERKREVKTG